MKAIAYTDSLPISDANSLINIELPQPRASGRNLLVKVLAIAVNPVDTKIRQRIAPDPGEYKVLGWDAVGEVVAVGEEASLFKPGDKVFYAGDLNRQGTNAEYQLVDERLVGHKPKRLTDAEAAALPLTAITAWEMLFEHLLIRRRVPDSNTGSDERILVIGAAGGVGSILLQIAKAVTGAMIIASASRQSSQQWVKKLGADHVVDHTKALEPQIEALGVGPITHVASLNNTDRYFETYINLLAPFGKIAMIDDPQSPLDVMKMKPKSLSLHIEFMYARSMFKAHDMDAQGKLLNTVAELVDQGYVQSTIGKHLGLINADNLKTAHAELESGKSIGKLVLEGF
ncbi:MAG: zinc-binding alcohol dehydrogenase family protein [Pseudomonadota bacterium]